MDYLVWALILIIAGPEVWATGLKIYSSYKFKGRRKTFPKLPKKFRLVDYLRANGVHCIVTNIPFNGIVSCPHLIPFKLCIVSTKAGTFSDKFQDFLGYHEIFHFYPERYGLPKYHRYNEILASLVAKEEFLKHYSREDFERTFFEEIKLISISDAITVGEIVDKEFDIGFLRKKGDPCGETKNIL